MSEFKRTITVYKNHFWDFYNEQTKKVQDRIDWTIGLVRTLRIVPKIYFDHIMGTDGLWEIRTQVGSNIYRVFCCFDEGNIVMLFNGFQKKTQKTPKKEIELAERLKKEYFDEKRK
ncbi:MAG: type II toxin-antitoxin system RelE/ParE family toxin [Proteiniphilum sp.]|uniref:type II toxin-antitoxin system RelE/ParE family toxin n=1 Tax=Proteiniphilum sp. TaxID=1926877 RepID=UPI0009273B40|nr:type II toxin-antitoxin system RelE/ParE family toxin [Proteiniphilum sp.]MEA5127048.1 type II toxin-antitoxin system RelE/ParE family toxin [Proteiniphilum sp.]OJV81913.1 MAG: addiction module toxin RelE [Bacteroidia bacterium 44-10]